MNLFRPNIPPSLAFATALSGSIALSGCSSQDTRSSFYHSVAECVRDGIYTREFCQEGYNRAQAENVRVAPQYQTLSDCNTDWDTCVPESSNKSDSSFFIPYMIGYWIGSTTTHPFRGSPYQTNFNYPLYRDRSGITISPSTQQQFSGFTKSGPARTTINPDYDTAISVRAAGRQLFTKGTSAASLGATYANRPSWSGGYKPRSRRRTHHFRR